MATKKLRISLYFSIVFLLVTSCTTVTTYGFSPEPTGDGSYRFTLYYNSDATDALIDKKASSVVDEIQIEYHHQSCTYERSSMVSASRLKEIQVEVTCDK